MVIARSCRKFHFFLAKEKAPRSRRTFRFKLPKCRVYFLFPRSQAVTSKLRTVLTMASKRDARVKVIELPIILYTGLVSASN
jgi:hypothetical protein